MTWWFHSKYLLEKQYAIYNTNGVNDLCQLTHFFRAFETAFGQHGANKKFLKTKKLVIFIRAALSKPCQHIRLSKSKIHKELFVSKNLKVILNWNIRLDGGILLIVQIYIDSIRLYDIFKPWNISHVILRNLSGNILKSFPP